MEPGEEVLALLDELEQIVREAKPPFGGGREKKVIEENSILDIVYEIRQVFPQQFTDAKRIVREEQEKLQHADRQAENIILDAQEQAQIIASDQEIVRRAKQQAEDIRSRAQEYERETRYNAEEYADTVLSHLEESLRSLSSTVSRVRQTLNENSSSNAEEQPETTRTGW